MPQARDEAGNVWEVDAQGNVVRLVQAAPSRGQVFAPPPDPTDEYKAPKAEADLANTRSTIADREADRRRAEALLPYEMRKAAADAAKAEAALNEQGAGGVDPMKLAQFAALEQQIARVEELYRAGPGSTKGFPRGLADYLPSDANSAFDSAAAGLGEVGLAAFRVPGVGSQSDAELRQFVQANTPSASDRDAAIEEKLRNLRTRLNATKSQLGIATPVEDNRPNAMLGGSSTPPPGAAPFGSDKKSVPIPDQMQQAHAQWIAQNAGRITPDNYAAFRAELDRQFGFTPDEAAYRKAAPGINEASRNSGYSPAIPPTTQEMSQVEQFRNDIVNNPIGAAATGALDAGSFGMVRALAPEQMGALEEARPVSTTLGQIGGAITGTSALGALGRQTLGRAAPSLLGGAGKARFGRNLAADATYGAAYGGITEGDPLTGAATGLIGSALGQGVGKAAGKAIGGVNVSPAVEALRNAGIPLTVGQTLGGFAKKLEDRFAGYPVVGDVIGNRRLEGLQAFNQKAFDEAGAPIGYTPNAAGLDGLTQLQQATGNAYDQATAGVRIPLDQQYSQDLTGIKQLANRLPPDAVPALGKVGENYILPITGAGEMTGDVFQNTQRALKMKRSSPPGSAQGFEQEWRDATSALMDANRGLMNRQGGQAVTQGLDSADMAYRLSKTLEDAVMRAKGGAGSGETFTFTPSQLQMAGQKSAAKFPGLRPFQQLADAGQEVLPSQVPDSGTAGRLATMAVPGALVGGGAGAGAIYGGGEGAQTGATTSAALAILAMLGGTKSGQKAINNLFTQRPKEARKLGQIIANRAGMFGSAGNILSQQAN